LSLANYGKSAWAIMPPVAGVASLLCSALRAPRALPRSALLASALAVAGVSPAAGALMFPFYLAVLGGRR